MEAQTTQHFTLLGLWNHQSFPSCTPLCPRQKEMLQDKLWTLLTIFRSACAEYSKKGMRNQQDLSAAWDSSTALPHHLHSCREFFWDRQKCHFCSSSRTS